MRTASYNVGVVSKLAKMRTASYNVDVASIVAITCVAGYRKATLHIGKKTNNMQTYRKKAYHV